MQERQLGRFVFGSVTLVLVHHDALRPAHTVFAVATGPFKHGSDAGTPAPDFLTARFCVTWAPGVDFCTVEAWWQDLMARPALRVVPHSGTCARVDRAAIARPSPQGPGARLVQVGCCARAVCSGHTCDGQVPNARHTGCRRAVSRVLVHDRW
jgi:hypothetical protein